jgi:acetylornithine/N-succinyldiaminopimelate aminotransferase
MSKTEEIIALYDRYVMPSYARSRVLVRGRGTKVWGADGRVYLDFIAGIAVVPLGHSHPAVVEAIREQAGVLTHVSNLYYTENQGLLAEKLSALGLGGKCFFGNSGAEANEGLIKLARLWGHEQGRHEVITMKNSFHGRTLATAAATGQTKIQKGFEPMPKGFHYAEYNDLDSVKEKVGEKTAAVLVEAVQGEGGIILATDEFMRGLRALCDEKGLLMLCDEVQCGLGRTGQWWGYEASGVKPDAFSVAKGLGNGFPIGAVCSNPKLADVFQPGKHASTFGGTPLACAAALATLKVIEEEDLLARAAEAGAKFRAGLEEFAGKYEHVKEVRGRGLMLGMELDQAAKPLTEMMAEQGVLALATAEKVVRFLPPLNVKDEEIEEALEIMDDCLAEMHGVKREEEAVEEEAAEPEAEAEETLAEPTEAEAVVEPEAEAEAEAEPEA